MFNNVFFTKRSRTCKVKKKKIRYAAICDAVNMAKMTRKKRINLFCNLNKIKNLFKIDLFGMNDAINLP